MGVPVPSTITWVGALISLGLGPCFLVSITALNDWSVSMAWVESQGISMKMSEMIFAACTVSILDV